MRWSNAGWRFLSVRTFKRSLFETVDIFEIIKRGQPRLLVSVDINNPPPCYIGTEGAPAPCYETSVYDRIFSETNAELSFTSNIILKASHEPKIPARLTKHVRRLHHAL